MTESDDQTRRDILWVEDQPSTIEGTLSELRLEAEGLRIDVAETVSHAEELLKTRSYKVILVDLRLPRPGTDFIDERGGLTLIGRLRKGLVGEVNKDVPCMLVTAQSTYALKVFGEGSKVLDIAPDQNEPTIYPKSGSIFPLVRRVLDLVRAAGNGR